jgi:hypothetical protein
MKHVNSGDTTHIFLYYYFSKKSEKFISVHQADILTTAREKKIRKQKLTLVLGTFPILIDKLFVNFKQIIFFFV